MSLDLTTLAAAKAYTDKKIPQGGGGVTPTAAEKIVDYTVDADGANAKSFTFTVEEYPKLAEYNHIRGIFRKAVNGSMPWVQILLNRGSHNTNDDSGLLAKQSAGSMGMCGFDMKRNGVYYTGYITAPSNISMYSGWTVQCTFPQSGTGRLSPMYLDKLTMLTIASYQVFLDEGGRIEIWGWND